MSNVGDLRIASFDRGLEYPPSTTYPVPDLEVARTLYKVYPFPVFLVQRYEEVDPDSRTFDWVDLTPEELED